MSLQLALPRFDEKKTKWVAYIEMLASETWQ